MQQAQTVGIDLPLKALVWQDEQGATWLSYNDPAYLAGRHGVGEPAKAAIVAMTAALHAIATKATAPVRRRATAALEERSMNVHQRATGPLQAKTASSPDGWSSRCYAPCSSPRAFSAISAGPARIPSVPASGYVALVLGVVFSLVVGVGLMALVFYSSRKGYDEPAVLIREPESDADDGQSGPR